MEEQEEGDGDGDERVIVGPPPGLGVQGADGEQVDANENARVDAGAEERDENVGAPVAAPAPVSGSPR